MLWEHKDKPLLHRLKDGLEFHYLKKYKYAYVLNDDTAAFQTFLGNYDINYDGPRRAACQTATQIREYRLNLTDEEYSVAVALADEEATYSIFSKERAKLIMMSR